MPSDFKTIQEALKAFCELHQVCLIVNHYDGCIEVLPGFNSGDDFVTGVLADVIDKVTGYHVQAI